MQTKAQNGSTNPLFSTPYSLYKMNSLYTTTQLILLLTLMATHTLTAKTYNYCTGGQCSECHTVTMYNPVIYKSCSKCVNSNPVHVREEVYTCEGAYSRIPGCLILEPGYDDCSFCQLGYKHIKKSCVLNTIENCIVEESVSSNNLKLPFLDEE